MASQQQDEHQDWFQMSSFPIAFPSHDALRHSSVEFNKFLAEDLNRRLEKSSTDLEDVMSTADEPDTFTMVTDSTTTKEIQKNMTSMAINPPTSEASTNDESGSKTEAESAFTRGLQNFDPDAGQDMTNKMLTENGDVALRSTTNALVDLFTELEDVVSGPRLRELLEAAWAGDPTMTLKIIFNARSIHLGKSSRHTFYRAAGWLAQNHPFTLMANLRWLSRPVIEKKAKKDNDDDVVLVDGHDADEDDVTKFDVRHGVAHGYWKDLLNILALAVNDKLSALEDPRDVLNVEPEHGQRRLKRDLGEYNTLLNRQSSGSKKRASKLVKQAHDKHRTRHEARNAADVEDEQSGLEKSEEHNAETTPEALQAKQRLDAKKKKADIREQRHDQAVKAFQEDHVYRALHLSVARLFAEQLQSDLAALRGTDAKAKRAISLCGKWAPSSKRFHDSHTFIVSTIAEIMYPRDALSDTIAADDSREAYLGRAREAYRQDISALRKHLDVVERPITAKAYGEIKYDRVPSLAMSKYSNLFIKNDFDRFDGYMDRVAEGKANISGATLMPSKLVSSVRSGVGQIRGLSPHDKNKLSQRDMLEKKTAQLQAKVVDAQWNTLVQRIKDSGSLSSSIAVCDVSGSMSTPRFRDGTCPMDTSIGLSLLMAEVTEPPFGSCFITFSGNPRVQHINTSAPFSNKVSTLERADWGGSTNVVAVFERLILPMAIKKKLTQEQMVKRVFVFSDMQFNECEHYQSGGRGKDLDYSGSFGRIKELYADAGYEVPELVFWNLAGGRAGYTGVGDATAPKPVSAEEANTSLVSGYSQGMLKVFLDNGSFEDPDDHGAEDDEVVLTKEEGSDGEETVKESVPEKKKMDPLRLVKKAVGHKAYEMLQVLD